MSLMGLGASRPGLAAEVQNSRASRGPGGTWVQSVCRLPSHCRAAVLALPALARAEDTSLLCTSVSPSLYRIDWCPLQRVAVSTRPAFRTVPGKLRCYQDYYHYHWYLRADSNSGFHLGQWQERPQKFRCGLRGPCTLEQCQVVGKSPNFTVQPPSHTHSLGKCLTLSEPVSLSVQ